MPYSALRDKKEELIRKARDGSVFLAPFTADPILTLTTTGADLAALPTGYQDVGFLSTDGATYPRETTLSEVESFGSVEPTRTDVVKDVITMQFTMQETKLVTIGLYTGADVTGLQGTHGTGEVAIAKPARPGLRYFRVLGLFVDETDDGEIYFGRWMPRSRVTELAEQKYADGDDPIEYQVTMQGFEDSDLGYSHKWMWGGPGWRALLSSMGITEA